MASQPHGAMTLRRRLRDWRRSRAARRRLGGRRVTVALTGSLAALFVLLLLALAYIAPESPGRRIRLDQLQKFAGDAKVVTVLLRDEDARIAGRLSDGDQFWVTYPKSDSATAALLDDLQAAGVQVSVDPQTGKAQVRLLVSVLVPLLILANLFALIVTSTRGGGTGIGEVITFGTIGARKLRRGHAHAVTFGDVAGADEAVVELAEVVDYLANPARYEALGAAPPKGVLLFGPPGCGKTLLAKAIAGEAGVPFVNVAGAEFVESLVGVGAARVRDLFARVRAVAPAIVFIDELDAAGRRRGGGEGGSDERDQTLNQLLVEMDGFEVSSGIVVIAATNRPDIIDPALLRPGRFDRHITVPLPDPEGRRLILELHARGKPVAIVDFESLARRTPGFSGADLANVVNEATLLAIRGGRGVVESPDFEEAVARVIGGPQRRGLVLSEHERLRLATYEAGRAVVAAALGRRSDVHRVSILSRPIGPRGAGSGADADAALLSAAHLRARLVATLGGPAAEVHAFGDVSTRAEVDLESATELARDLAGRYGMSERLGRARLVASSLDEPMALSERRHTELDEEVARLVAEAEQAATRVLRAEWRHVDALSKELLTDEHLEGTALDALLGKVAPHVVGSKAGANGAPRAAKRVAKGRV